jgi:sortase A
MRRIARILGTLLIVGGIGCLGWAVVVWRWQDPFTALYTTYEQHQLASMYQHRVEAYRPLPLPLPVPVVAHGATATRQVSARGEALLIRTEARRYRLASREGDPIGRIRVPRLGLSIILVNGTGEGALTKGPGRYLGSFMPGEEQLIYIAGHRTTYLAPFSHIDSLRTGDTATIEMPYATFTYRITEERVVPATDLDVLKSHGREVLILQACHPRFFASHRYLAYAALVKVTPRAGPAYTVSGGNYLAAASPAAGT